MLEIFDSDFKKYNEWLDKMRVTMDKKKRGFENNG